MRARGSRRAAGGGLQRLGELAQHQRQDRRKAEQDARRHRRREREEEDVGIEADLLRARDRTGVRHLDQLHAAEREQEPEHRADTRKQNAFSGELTGQPHGAGAERAPNGDLAAPRFRARQQEIRDVHARDQQDERDRAEQHEQRRTNVGDDLGLQRETHNVVKLGMKAVRTALHRVFPCGIHQALQLRLRLLGAHAWLEAADDGKKMSAAVSRLCRVDLQRRPDLRRIDFARRKRKILGHDADDVGLAAAEQRLFADDVRIAAVDRLPRPIRDHADVVRSRLVVIRRDHAAKLRRDAERAEQRAGDAGARHPHRLRLTREVGATHGPAVERLPGFGVAAQVEEFRRRDPETMQAAIGERGEFRIDANESPRLLIRQRTQQHGIHHAEDRAGGANAERKAQYRCQRERRARAPHAETELHVLPERVHAASVRAFDSRPAASLAKRPQADSRVPWADTSAAFCCVAVRVDAIGWPLGLLLTRNPNFRLTVYVVENIYGRSAAGHPLRLAHAAEVAGLQRGRGPYPGARHRREYRHLHRAEHRDAALPAGARPAAARPAAYQRVAAQFRADGRRHALVQLCLVRRAAQAEAGVQRRDGLRAAGHRQDRGALWRYSRRSARRHGERELLLRTRGAHGGRPRLHRRRRSSPRGDGSPELRLLVAALWARSEDHRPDHLYQECAVHHRRRYGSRVRLGRRRRSHRPLGPDPDTRGTAALGTSGQHVLRLAALVVPHDGGARGAGCNTGARARSGATGVSVRRLSGRRNAGQRREAARAVVHGAAWHRRHSGRVRHPVERPDGHGGARARHRVQQCRHAAHRAQHRAAARILRPRGAGCDSRTAFSPAADGGHSARRRRRRARLVVCALDGERVRQVGRIRGSDHA